MTRKAKDMYYQACKLETFRFCLSSLEPHVQFPILNEKLRGEISADRKAEGEYGSSSFGNGDV